MQAFAQKLHQPQVRLSSSRVRSSTATSAAIGHRHPMLVLQRAIGNQAVQRLAQSNTEDLEMRAMPTSADRLPLEFQRLPSRPPAPALSQRKCDGCTEGEQDEGPAQDAAAIARQAAPGREDEFPAPGQSVISRKVTAAEGASPRIQRVATWAAGAVHQSNNLANSYMNGVELGVTWPTLNGPTFWSSADARTALKKPTLAFSSAASGGVNVKVVTVPTNTGSFDETVLAAGPWTLAVLKTRVGAMFPTLTMCTGAGNTTFRAIGDPTDAAMFAANRRHEDHHAADHRAAFNGSIVPWDTKLTAAAAAGTNFNAPTEPEAEAALWTAMGGTPDQVADAFMNACQAAVIAFHGTPAGGAGGAPTDPTASADCSTSSIKATNPS